MKFGISSYVWSSPFRNEDTVLFEKAKKFGFDEYEVSVETPGSFDPHFIKDVADRIGINLDICGAFGARRDPGSADPEIRKEAVQYLKTLIDHAVIVGSPYVSGPMYATSGDARAKDDDEKKANRSRIVESLKEVADYAEKYGINMAIEPLNRFETDVINTAAQCKELIEAIGSPRFGYLLDVFHMNIEEKSITGAIELAGDRLFDFHACANDRGIPGEDHYDWSAIANSLKKIDYKGPMVIESFSSGIKEIAKSCSLWRPVAPDMDTLASKGVSFLKTLF